MSLDAINALLLDGSVKGMPGGVAPFRLDSIAAKGWNLLREAAGLDGLRLESGRMPLIALDCGSEAAAVASTGTFLTVNRLSAARAGRAAARAKTRLRIKRCMGDL